MGRLSLSFPVYEYSSLPFQFEEELRRRLLEEQRESDQRWIAHEKEQIRHLQDSHEFMLKFLHKEVERFQGLYKGISSRLFDVNDPIQMPGGLSS